MKVILVGYQGSKKIIPASSYLIDKYLPKNFDIYFLNFGEYDGKLIRGNYVSLDDEQRGGVSSWSKYICNYLSSLDDEFVVFSLDDYFLSKPLCEDVFKKLLSLMKNDKSICAAKLGFSPSYRTNDYTLIDSDTYILKKGAVCPATTQYNIWDREYLISILEKISNPWEFEGISILDKNVIGSLSIPLKYPEPSSLSSRHPEEINVFGNCIEDIENCIEFEYLNEEDLILGQWDGAPVKKYSDCKNDILSSLVFCPSGEREYYNSLFNLCVC
jgi:hypothetical protein